jgi:hypothetical protein
LNIASCSAFGCRQSVNRHECRRPNNLGRLLGSRLGNRRRDSSRHIVVSRSRRSTDGLHVQPRTARFSFWTQLAIVFVTEVRSSCHHKEVRFSRDRVLAQLRRSTPLPSIGTSPGFTMKKYDFISPQREDITMHICQSLEHSPRLQRN